MGKNEFSIDDIFEAIKAALSAMNVGLITNLGTYFNDLISALQNVVNAIATLMK